MATHYLKDRFHDNNAVQVVHLYFEQKTRLTQTEVALHILKQILSDLDDVPPQLEALYNKSTKPDIAACKELLTSCAEKFSSVYAVFDAIDECSNANQKDVVSLFAHLQRSTYRLLISTRPHLLENLREQLEEIQTLEIYANESDLKNYIMTRLSEKRNKDINLQAKCLELTKRVQGM
jgi:NACHT domain